MDSIYDRLLKLEGEIDVLYLRTMLLNEEAYYKRIKVDRTIRLKIESKKNKNIFHIKIGGQILTDLAEPINMELSQLVTEIHVLGKEKVIWKNNFSKSYDQFEFKVREKERLQIKVFLINSKDRYTLDDSLQFILNSDDKFLNRTEILTRLWQYAKDKALFKGSLLICDDKLHSVFKEREIDIQFLNRKINGFLKEMDPLEFEIGDPEEHLEYYDIKIELDDLNERPLIFYDSIDTINKLNCKDYNISEHIDLLEKKLVKFTDFLKNPTRAVQYWIIFDLIELVNKNEDIFKNNRRTFYNKNIQRAIYSMMNNLK